MIKLALFDLDKTLLDDKSRLPENFDEYVNLLEQEGVKVGIASARTFFSIEELFQEKLERLAGICDNGNTIFQGPDYQVLNSWKKEDMLYLVSFLDRDPDIALIFSDMERYYADPISIERCISHGRDWMAERLHSLQEAMDAGARISNCHYICFWETYPSIFQCVQEKLQGPLKECCESWDLNEAGWGWIAVCAPGGGKAAGIRSLLQEMKLTGEEAMVFGDSDNDISMFGEVKYSYAMKNASPAARAAAACVTQEDNNHNGALRAALDRVRQEKRQ
ncbi:MAG: HAD family hydrolase [Lachnospiraceae bacterium]|nr:HAD family hydrolase [Lachnospiraceae bacterium]